MARTWIALLHSIVLDPGRRVRNADLVAISDGLGFRNPRALLATGNLIFDGPTSGATPVEIAFEAAFAVRFGRKVDIIVRAADDWPALMRGNPFPAAAAVHPAAVSVRIMRQPVDAAVAERLGRLCTGEEQLAVVDGDLWLHLPHGTATSRLARAITPARAGVGTFRNWNTVRRIGRAIAG